MNPSYGTAGNNNVNSVLSDSLKSKNGDGFSEDRVSLSQEAMELMTELRYKKNLRTIKTYNEVSFDRVSKALPATEGFNDMLAWLGSTSKKKSSAIGNKGPEEPDRNVYQKDPKKYAEMWLNMYEHYTATMKDLGLDKEASMQRQVLDNESVSEELMRRFTSRFDAETSSLLSYFNITI